MQEYENSFIIFQYLLSRSWNMGYSWIYANILLLYILNMCVLENNGQDLSNKKIFFQVEIEGEQTKILLLQRTTNWCCAQSSLLSVLCVWVVWVVCSSAYEMMLLVQVRIRWSPFCFSAGENIWERERERERVSEMICSRLMSKSVLFLPSFSLDSEFKSLLFSLSFSLLHYLFIIGYLSTRARILSCSFLFYIFLLLTHSRSSSCFVIGK